MNPIAVLRRHFANVERSRQMQEEIRDGIANLTELTNRHLIKLTEVMEAANQRQMLDEIRAGIVNLASMTNQRLEKLALKLDGTAGKSDAFGPQHPLPPSTALKSVSADSLQQRAAFPVVIDRLAGDD